MANRIVPTQYATIREACENASDGDWILIKAPFTGPEDVDFYVDNLTFSAPATITGIVLRPSGVLGMTLVGGSPFEVYASDGITVTGGTGAEIMHASGSNNTLNGGKGNDTFYLDDSSYSGSIDGGAGIDTVVADGNGFSFGSASNFTFTGVEKLDTQGVFRGSLAQLAQFSTILDGTNASSQISVELEGAGGTIDFTTRVTGLQSIDLNASFADSAVVVTGSAKDDQLTGTSFNDTLNGGAGNDTLAGGEGNDTLDGGEGNDTLVIDGNFGDPGIDTLKGGAGNDTFKLENFNQFTTFAGTVDGGADVDTIAASSFNGFTVTNVERLDTYYFNGTAAQLAQFTTIFDSRDAGSQIEIELVGAGGTIDFTNRVTGLHSVKVTALEATAGVVVTGSARADDLSGTGFNDTLDGGAGNDAIFANGGIDTLKGGAGNDTFQLSSFDPDLPFGGTVDGGADTDTVTGFRLSTYTFTNVERLDTSDVRATAAQLTAFGTILDSSETDTQIRIGLGGAGGAISFATRVTGLQSVDVDASDATAGVVVTGTARADQLRGSAFNDTLDGGVGGDTLVANGGIDTLKGGGGNDTFVLRTFDSSLPFGGTVDGGADTDRIVASSLNGFTVTNVEVLDVEGGYFTGTIAQLSQFATITDSDGVQSGSQINIDLLGAGGTISFATRVTGLLSVNVDASDTTSAVALTGTAKDDRLRGSSFNDTLDGGKGSDTLVANGGIDTLTGGAGNDTFRLFRSDTSLPFGGTVDGGADTDTVTGFDLGTYTFANVETLDTYSVRATAAQLAAFATITDSDEADSQINIDLAGTGGTIDFTTRVTGLHSVDVDASDATSGVVVTGTTRDDGLRGSGFNDTLDGGAGNDTIEASQGIDTLTGGAGNDTFRLFRSDTSLPFGGTVDGGADTDTVSGTDLGTYTFTNVEKLDVSFVRATVAQLSSFATITDSGSANGRINFNLVGAGGTIDFSTRIKGLQSVYVDAYEATAGVVVTGTAKDDQLRGSAFNDTLDGGAGNDTVGAFQGIDTLKGNAGNDVFDLYGNEPANSFGGTVDGGADVDTVRSSYLGTYTFANVEKLDTDDVTATAAQLSSFATIFDSGNASEQIGIYLVGAGGTISFATRVTGLQSVYVDAFQATAGVVVTGTAKDDQLRGSAFNDTLDGGTGNDILEANQGIDALKGGAGSDTFRLWLDDGDLPFGGTVDGGTEIDTVRGYNLGTYTFANVETLDTPAVRATTAQLASFTTITDTSRRSGAVGIELVGAGGTIDFTARVTGKKSVSVNATEVSAGVTVTGTANNDVFVGSRFADTLDGGAGADIFESRGGTDTLRGGAGADIFRIGGSKGSVDGGTEIDKVQSHDLGAYTFANVEILETDSVWATAAQLSSFATIRDNDSENSQIKVFLRGAGTVSFATRVGEGNGVEFDGTKAVDDIGVTGTASADTIYGSSFDDQIIGGAGADILAGGQGNDVYTTDGLDTIVEAANFGTDLVNSSVTLTLGKNLENLTLTGAGAVNGTGNALANVLTGNAAANTLNGGLGIDRLTGGLGADIFVFNSALGTSNVDVIADFVSKTDKIHLENTGIFTKLTVANQSLVATQFKDITDPATAIDADDYIQYNHTTGALYYDADGNGTGAKVQFATLTTHPLLVSTDFYVI